MKNLLHRLATPDPLIAMPYRGFANGQGFFLKGRVLEFEGIHEGESDSKLRNLRDMIKRFESDEIEGARLEIRIGGEAHEAISDREGFFTVEKKWPQGQPAPAGNWVPYSVRLLDSPGNHPLPAGAFASEVLLPSATAGFGIITDMDDTVLQTHMTSRLKLKMAYTTLFKDSHQRLPMEGVPDLLRALTGGGDGQRQNPVFYVSDSPWNIYDLLEDFLADNDLPKGPILLRDYGAHLLQSKKQERDIHKLVALRQIMAMCPGLPFVMLGDTASKDADYYLRMAEEFEGRVLAIYIRQTRDTANARRIAKLITDNAHVQALLVRESREIWEHARGLGLVQHF